jgi:hypothetical protein
MEPHGIYRERNGWGNQHCARVKYDEHKEFDVPDAPKKKRGAGWWAMTKFGREREESGHRADTPNVQRLT